MKTKATIRLLVLSIILAITILATPHLLPSPLQPAHATNAPTQSNTSVFVTTPPGFSPQGNNITDLTKQYLGKSITFNVNISLSPPINAFLVFLYYNTTMFTVNTVNYQNSVLGPNAQLQRLCIDGLPQPGSNPCKPPDGLGVISIALYLLGNASSHAPLTSGQLFQVTFNVLASGLGQVHLVPAAAELTALTAAGLGGSGGYVQFTTVDGYYTNIMCGPVACKPPIVQIGFTPLEPTIGSPVAFNASAIDPNQGAKIDTYTWDWGDGSTVTGPTNQTTTKHIFVVNILGGQGGPCLTDVNASCAVTLSVHDTASINWMYSKLVPLLHLNIRLVVSSVIIDHILNVVPGTLVHISANIQNYSTIAEKANLTISLEGTILNRQNFTLAPGGSRTGTTGHLNATWATDNLVPRAYALIVYVCQPPHCGNGDRQSGIQSADPVKGETLYGENVTLNTRAEAVSTTYIILVFPQTLGALSLSLLQTAGLSVLVVAAVILGVGRFLRKPSYETELV